MQEPEVTILVVPRERFSLTERCLENVYARTKIPFRLVYVSAGAPGNVRAYLDEELRRRGFRLIHAERYLTNNQARNLGLQEVLTPYVVFLDNDSLGNARMARDVARLLKGDWVPLVGPLYLMGEPEMQIIHMAGGMLRYDGGPGGRVLYSDYLLLEQSLADLPAPLQRGTCDFIEFHCLLARRDWLERIGGLDEELLTMPEHFDICMLSAKLGGDVYLEPAAQVSYLAPPPCSWWDLPFYLWRWNENWCAASMRHFRAKWGIAHERYVGDKEDLGQEDTHVRWARAHRRRLAGLRFSAEADRTESPLQEAQLTAALFQSVDRDLLDLALVSPDNRMIQSWKDLDPPATIEHLPEALRAARSDGLNLRLLPQERPGSPALLAIDELDAERMAKVRPHSFLTLKTGPDAFQCWLAIARGDSRSAAALRRLVGARRGPPGNIQARVPGSSEPVDVQDGRAGLLNTVWDLEDKGLMPFLWSGTLC